MRDIMWPTRLEKTPDIQCSQIRAEFLRVCREVPIRYARLMSSPHILAWDHRPPMRTGKGTATPKWRFVNINQTPLGDPSGTLLTPAPSDYIFHGHSV